MNAATTRTIQDVVAFDTPDDQERKRLFLDVILPRGGRLLAVADPVRPSAHGLHAAAAAVSAFEDAFGAAAAGGADTALDAAFAAANRAVAAANHGATAQHRALVGLAAVVVDGGSALIGLAPPAQVLLLQDGRLFALPEPQTWSPLYMPAGDDPDGEPLGLRDRLRPILRRTEVRADDMLVIGTGAVGRCLATAGAVDWAAEPDVAGRLAELVACADVDGAYAACVRVGALSTEEPAVRPDEPGAAVGHAGDGVAGREPVAGGAGPADLHDWLIDRSERLLGRRATADLPLPAGRPVALPPGAASVRRYTPPRALSLSPDLRCRLPRGPRVPFSKRAVVALLTVLLMLGAGGFGYDVRQARANRQDRHLATARGALQAAAAAPTSEEANRHLETAQRSLDEALDNGAKRVEIEQSLGELTRIRDAAHGVNRLTSIARIGVLPDAVRGGAARLIALNGRLYLVAGAVYEVDGGSRRLTTLLAPGERVGKIKVRQVVDATVDRRELVVTDGKAVFRLRTNGKWSATKLGKTAEAFGWEQAECGAYKGSFYVLAPDNAQILKYGSRTLDERPDEWLTEQAAVGVGEAVDMVVDGSIHVLRADGAIETFYRGASKGVYQVDPGVNLRPIAMTGTPGAGFLYVLGRDEEQGRLLRVDPAAGATSLYLAPAPGHPGYDWAAADALRRAEDIAVDEQNGLVYFVTAEEIWQASIG